MDGSAPFARAADDARALEARLGRHDVALVLGSGWADVGDALGSVQGELAMADLASFPRPTVAGHGGVLRSVDVSGHRVLVVAGRSHLYEGRSAHEVVHGVRAAVLSGCGTVLLTNAAGSLRSEHGVGQPVLIADQLNLTGTSPLVGADPPEGFPGRFCDLSDLYSARLRALATAADPSLPEGVYAGVLGGSYETPAEIRMYQGLGADLIGMSTVLEAIAAHHLGADVLGVSLVTNLAAGLSAEVLDHADVLAAGRAAQPRLVALLRSVIEAR